MYPISENNLSTRTMITNINVEFDNIYVFKNLPIKYKMENYNCQIVAMYHKNEPKGDMSFFKKNLASFRNAINIIIQDESKNTFNVKLTKWGKFQISGCKYLEETYECIKYLIELILLKCPNGIQKKEENIELSFTIVMTNYIYNTGFKIDKEKLNNLMVRDISHRFYCLFETAFGYTGLNLKRQIDPSKYDLKIPSFTLINGEWIFKEKPYTTIGKTKKFNSFLVFHSGKVICSGMTEKSMNDDYLFFSKYIHDHKKEIIEWN